MSDSPVSPVSSAFAPATGRRKQELTDSMDVEKMAGMMNELHSTIRALEEKLEATGMENDLLQQRMAEMIDERTGSTPPKFAKPSSDPIATHGDTKNFAKIATSGDTADFYLDGGELPSDTSDFYLALDKDESSAAWRDLNPVAAIAKFVNVPAVSA